jgi:hypothetical protein
MIAKISNNFVFQKHGHFLANEKVERKILKKTALYLVLQDLKGKPKIA